MNQTIRQQQLLRCSRMYPKRRLTIAGRFWCAYVIALLVGVYAVVDLVERVMR